MDKNSLVMEARVGEFHYKGIKKEFDRSLSNKWTKTLYQDYLHRFANFCVTVLNTYVSFQKELFLTTCCC